MTNKTRLKKLEKAYKAGKPEEWITVIEDMDQPEVFKGRDKDGVERLWSEEELDSLDASGVNVIRIVWKKTPIPGELEDHD